MSSLSYAKRFLPPAPRVTAVPAALVAHRAPSRLLRSVPAGLRAHVSGPPSYRLSDFCRKSLPVAENAPRTRQPGRVTESRLLRARELSIVFGPSVRGTAPSSLSQRLRSERTPGRGPHYPAALSVPLSPPLRRAVVPWLHHRPLFRNSLASHHTIPLESSRCDVISAETSLNPHRAAGPWLAGPDLRSTPQLYHDRSS